MENTGKAKFLRYFALLIAAGKYCWHGSERVRAFHELVRQENLSGEYAELYEKAFHWKLEPEVVMPADPAAVWRKCRNYYLDCVALCAGEKLGAGCSAVIAGLRHRTGRERSLKNALRWLLHGRTMRPPLTFFDPPVVSVLEILYVLLSESPDYAELPDRLRRLWNIFN